MDQGLAERSSCTLKEFFLLAETRVPGQVGVRGAEAVPQAFRGGGAEEQAEVEGLQREEFVLGVSQGLGV